MNKYFWLFALALSTFQAYAQCPAGQDCGKPVVICKNGISGSLSSRTNPVLRLFVQDLLESATDSVTPSADLQLSMRRKGTGQGFPLDSAGRLVTQLTWGCADIGTQFVEIWARDLAGNAGSCETYVAIDDRLGVCPGADTMRDYRFCFLSFCGGGLEEIELTLKGNPGQPSPLFSTIKPKLIADTCATYDLSSAFLFSPNYLITPVKNDNHLSGVTTVDLALISKHILGQQLITNPYALIAADADQSGSVTVRDILILRRLIIGIDNELPGGSWRFIREDFTFPNKANPFATPFPEGISIGDLKTNRQNGRFIGIKVGDVNCSQ